MSDKKKSVSKATDEFAKSELVQQATRVGNGTAGVHRVDREKADQAAREFIHGIHTGRRNDKVSK